MQQAKDSSGTICRKEIQGLFAEAGAEVQVRGPAKGSPRMVKGAGKAATLDRGTPRESPADLGFSSSLGEGRTQRL